MIGIANKSNHTLKKKKCTVLKIKYDELESHFDKKNNFFLNQKLKDVNGIWVRFINNGTLEEITTKLTFLHLLEELKVYIHNPARVIEKTVDKVRTTGVLNINNVNSPETIVKIGHIKNLKLKYDYLLKPIFGSQGKNIIFLKKNQSTKNLKAIGNIFYLQRFLGDIRDKIFCDIRVLVSNHKPICAMERFSRNFITNAYQGASTRKINLDKRLVELTEKVSKIFGLGYGGIDIIKFENEYYVLEVNSIPSWKAIQKTETKDITEILVNDFLQNVKKCKQKL